MMRCVSLLHLVENSCVAPHPQQLCGGAIIAAWVSTLKVSVTFSGVTISQQLRLNGHRNIAITMHDIDA